MNDNDAKRILILGAGGQLGRALMQQLNERALNELNERAIGLTREQADLSQPALVPQVLDEYAPSAVINAAAHTQVDRAEQEEDLAHTINGESPGVVARWCAARDIPFVHFSTDYVFDGSGQTPWREDDLPAPLNTYGRSKLAGENAVAQAGGKWLTFRTSWVYDATGRNFFTTMLRLARERESLQIVADQHGAPTYAPHLAREAIAALHNAQRQAEFPSGIYHLCGDGETTWRNFALRIFESARARGIALKINEVGPIETKDYPTPAQRPLNSRLDLAKTRATLWVGLPHWENGLEDCFTEYCKTADER